MRGTEQSGWEQKPLKIYSEVVQSVEQGNSCAHMPYVGGSSPPLAAQVARQERSRV